MNNTFSTFMRLWGKIGPLFALFIVVAIFGILEPSKFLSVINLSNIVGQTVVIAISAVGMTFVIISAGIDLSVGSIVALSGVSAAYVVTSGWGQAFGEFNSIIISVLAGTLAGTLCGIISGSVITLGKLPPFIVTLGMMSIVRGTALQSTDGIPIYGVPEWFKAIGRVWVIDNLFGFDLGKNNILIPYSLFYLIPVALIGAFLLNYTVFGVQTFAVGSNERTARLCGVRVWLVKLGVYAMSGLTAGLAGVIHASRLNSGQPSEGVAMELEVIAAVVIGGASLMGGEGTILGSIVGAFIITILRNGCNLVGVSPYYQQIVIGLIIIFAVYIDQLRHKVSSAKK